MSAPAAEDAPAFCEIAGKRLHMRRIAPDRTGAPVVFLHEGLGSVELWREFPEMVLASCGRPGLVYSRHGNGWSDPWIADRPVSYLHDHALDVLPAVLAAAGVDRPPLLVGHSDGASIAIVHAGTGHPVAGLVLIAPHVFVEPETVAAIAALDDDFGGSEMAEKMAAYHVDPEATFHGWADAWLSDGFRSWNIEEYLAAIDRPVLLIQGTDDEYGTMRQLDAVESAVTGPVRRMVVDGAGHAPHLSHGEAVAAAVGNFIAGVG